MARKISSRKEFSRDEIRKEAGIPFWIRSMPVWSLILPFVIIILMCVDTYNTELYCQPLFFAIWFCLFSLFGVGCVDTMAKNRLFAAAAIAAAGNADADADDEV